MNSEKTFAKVALSLVLALLCIVLFVLASGCSRDADQPGRVGVQVGNTEEHEVSFKGSIKYVRSTGGTVIEKHVPRGNGDTVVYYYRDGDGTLKEIVEEYKSADGSGKRLLKAKSTWAADGKTFVSGELYRPDGTLMLTRKALTDGRWQTDRYFPDGWKFTSQMRDPSSSTWDETFFRPNGSIWAKQSRKRESQWWVREFWLEMYAEDGKTRLWRIDHLNYGETRVSGFTPNEYGRLITYYNADGSPIYRQWWNSWWNQHLNQSGWLKFVEEIGEFGQPVRKIWVEDTGEEVIFLKEVRLADGTLKEFRTYREPEVELQEIESWQPGSGQPTRSRKFHSGTLQYLTGPSGEYEHHAAWEGIHETLDPRRFSRPPAYADFQARLAQMQGEDTTFLGERDDSDPANWYHQN